MKPTSNTVIQADCIEWLGDQEEAFADLIFADPPFNIGYKYDVYEDRKACEEYTDWTRQWMAACYRVLSPIGSFWIAIGDEYAAEVRLIGRDLNLCLRNWVVWYYTFGQNTKRKFGRSHTHLLYFTKHPKEFAFDDKAVRVFSDRQREYADKRASKLGKIPDDTWSEFPRVCGTFQEREGWHPCQMPESVLSRIIRVSSEVGNLVLDPFAGSGTTLAVAKKLSRDYIGIELSSAYVEHIERRLRRVEPRDKIAGESRKKWPQVHREELASLYVENGVATERLHEQPELWFPFVQQFNMRMANIGFEDLYSPNEVWIQLERLRKSGKLGRIKIHAPVKTTGDYPPPDPAGDGGPGGLFPRK